MNELKLVLQKLREIPSFNSLKSVDLGAVEMNTEEIAEVLIPFLNEAQNLQEFII